jgi:DNA-binding transcriptional ArsR family regulator
MSETFQVIETVGGCPPKSPIAERPLLAPAEARRLEALFQILANDTRLRLLHALVRAGEMSPSELSAALGMKPQAVSNQLQRLTDKGILESRRNGVQVYYRIVDPCVVSLLDQGLCLAEDAEARRR